MMKVVRKVPIYLRPYMLFSPPYAELLHQLFVCVCNQGKGQVVLFDEFGNGAFGRSGFEQLNFHVTYFQESGSYLLIFYGFNVVAF